MMMLDLLPTFHVFATCLSLTETGRRCGLTQPAVHGQLKRLAASVDAVLYVREGRELVLTERGAALAIVARDVLERCRSYEDGPGPVRIAAGRGAWTHVLPEVLGTWIRAEGLQPMVADGPTAEAAVHEGRAHFGVAVTPDPTRFDTRPLCTVDTVIVAPAGVDPATDLPHARWILPRRGRPHRRAVEDWLTARGLPIRVAAECDDWSVMIRWVELGVGWAAVNSVIPTRGLPTAPCTDGPRQTYHLFWRQGRGPDALQRLGRPA